MAAGVRARGCRHALIAPAGALAAVLVATLGGCSSGDPGSSRTPTATAAVTEGPPRRPVTRADLIDNTFVAHAYRRAGTTHELARHRFTLEFRDHLRRLPGDRIMIGTPCNSGGGRFTLRDGRLRVTDMAQTMMFCAGAPGREEAVLFDLISSRPAVTSGGGHLTLVHGTTRIVFRADGNPHLPKGFEQPD